MHSDERRAKRVLLIGWDAADWQFTGPLMQAGRMPHLAGLVQRGVAGNLASLQPMLSPMLWNAVATGRPADAHGVHGFVEPLPDGSNIRPVSSRSRRCKALWNILTQSSMASNVVGWYASHPAEPINGTMVSNLFEQPKGGFDEDWPIPDGAVHPADSLETLTDLRVHPSEIDADTLAVFVPDLQNAAQKCPKKLQELRVLLAQTVSIHAVTTHLIEHTDWDFTASYYEGIDRFGHAFMHLHPPLMEHADPEEFELFQHVMTGCYLFHDMMLGRLLELAGDDTTVILISDHGYHHGLLRPDPREGQAEPTDWHRPLGVAALAGPGIKQRETLFGATLMDVCPTILRLLGLPTGLDMPGRPWAEIFDQPLAPLRTPTWELTPGNDGRLPEDAAEDPEAAQAVLQQLIELGYVDPPSEDTAKTVAQARLTNTLNLTTALRATQRPQKALDLLNELSPEDAQSPAVVMQKALCLVALGQADRCRQLLAALETDHGIARLRMIHGVLAEHEGNPDQALKHFEDAIIDEPRSATLRCRIGAVLITKNRFADAEPHYQAALEIDPDHAEAFDGLSQTARHAGRLGDAIDHALDAVARRPYFPRAHFHLAQALADNQQFAEARDALNMVTRQSSKYAEAHHLFAGVLTELGDAHAAAEQRRLAEEAELARKMTLTLQPSSPE